MTQFVNTRTCRQLMAMCKHRREGGAIVDKIPSTYTLLTGGRFLVADEEKNALFEAIKADQLSGNMPSLNEVRSLKFPMYLDLDFHNLPIETLTAEAVDHVALLCTRCIERFYPDASPITCLVCTKARATREGDEGAWKHGVHLHWPAVVLEVDAAQHIRVNIVHALHFVSDWTSRLGVRTPPWDDIVDRAIFDNPMGGLRMVGAPKVRRCACHGTDAAACDVCHFRNKQYVSDANPYQLTSVVVDGADAAAREEILRHYKSNTIRMLRALSVRRDVTTPLTPGFRPFDGCVPPEAPRPSNSRKRPHASLDDAAKLTKTEQKDEVTDKRITDIVRKILIRQSSHYAESRMRIFRHVCRKKQSYRVLLSGVGARYCTNKGDFHTGNNVFMQIVRFGSGFIAQMRCWSKKQVVRPRGCVTCGEYVGDRVELSAIDAAVLFPRVETGVPDNPAVALMRKTAVWEQKL